MTFEFNESFDTESTTYDSVQHMLDFAIENDYDLGDIDVFVSEDTEEETLVAIAAEIRSAIDEAERKLQAKAEAERQRRRRPGCNIGPYANGICTICGGNEPS